MNILVTGGSGYIGSHTCVELINQKYNVIILDNLSNSKESVIDKIKQITGIKPLFYKGDILNINDIEKVFKENKIDAVIHLAGKKAVGESVNKPLMYYENNISGTINLLMVMEKYNCKNMVFSSSATVYGDSKIQPLKESFPTKTPTNPYGKTKLFNEVILTDLFNSDPSWNIEILRYFNPIGAHPSGLIGDDPNGIPNNLMPYISRVAIKKLDHLSVYGNDYNTHDGTGIRDYIHVCDLASGHVLALNHIFNNKGLEIYNLGTGNGQSVLDVVNAFEKANDIKIPYQICERRAGDIDISLADPTKANNELGFKTKYDIVDMCKSSFEFQKKNPDGIK